MKQRLLHIERSAHTNFSNTRYGSLLHDHWIRFYDHLIRLEGPELKAQTVL